VPHLSQSVSKPFWIVADTKYTDVTGGIADEGIEGAAKQVLTSTGDATPPKYQQVWWVLAKCGQNGHPSVTTESLDHVHRDAIAVLGYGPLSVSFSLTLWRCRTVGIG
jgi:hypothetical protein